jgi:hypothetical protein
VAIPLTESEREDEHERVFVLRTAAAAFLILFLLFNDCKRENVGDELHY